MNNASLRALLIDQHLGELPPEVAELLEEHLAMIPPAQAEAGRIRESLELTASAVRQHPDLARVESTGPARASRAPRHSRSWWLGKAAAIAALAAVTGAGGFLAGQKRAPSLASPPSAAEDSARPPRKDSPWARYRFATAREGIGQQIVRVDAEQPAPEALR